MSIKVLDLPYEQFHTEDEMVQAVNYAYVRYLVLFVQERGKLPALFETLRTSRAIDFRWADDDVTVRTPSTKGDLSLLASVLDMRSDQVEPAFRHWLPTVLPTTGQCK